MLDYFPDSAADPTDRAHPLPTPTLTTSTVDQVDLVPARPTHKLKLSALKDLSGVSVHQQQMPAAKASAPVREESPEALACLEAKLMTCPTVITSTSPTDKDSRTLTAIQRSPTRTVLLTLSKPKHCGKSIKSRK